MLTWYIRYLTQVERRLSNLESLFADLLPDVDLDEALASTSRDPAAGSLGTRAEPSVPSAKGAAASQKPPENVEESISEAVPDEADGFDWQEDVNELADGMASLSVEPKGTGYLGMALRARLICGKG